MSGNAILQLFLLHSKGTAFTLDLLLQSMRLHLANGYRNLDWIPIVYPESIMSVIQTRWHSQDKHHYQCTHHWHLEMGEHQPHTSLSPNNSIFLSTVPIFWEISMPMLIAWLERASFIYGIFCSMLDWMDQTSIILFSLSHMKGHLGSKYLVMDFHFILSMMLLICKACIVFSSIMLKFCQGITLGWQNMNTTPSSRS